MHTLSSPGSRPPRRVWRVAALGAVLLACSSATWAANKASARPVPEPLPPDPPLTTTPTIDAQHGRRVYVPDLAISHITDGRIRVLDAASGKFLGMISTAYVGNMALSPKRDEVYVATTHLSRSTRGERADVLEVYGADDLAFKYEVLLPPKRAQALNYRHLVATTANGRYVLVQNATPATSVTVVDLKERKVAAEVPNPGCWGALPAAGHPTRFSSLCGDGTMLTVTLDEQGQPAERQSSGKLFDADQDAWFHNAERVGDRYWYVSFQGKVTELNLGGAVAQVTSTHDLIATKAERAQGWRPGGYQNAAVDPSGRYLVAAMHPKGGEGSHKLPADKLWVMDLRTGKRLPSIPGNMAIALTFSASGERLHVLDGATNTLHVMSWKDGRARPMAKHAAVGETITQLESHD
jgi:methylamine dehydrogenase heavy chain